MIAHIEREVLDGTGKPMTDFRLLRAKSGVHVYRCVYDGMPAIAKYFEREEDRREIRNYRMLQACGVPTIPTYVLGESVIVMEDIARSSAWRLGTADDMCNTNVATGLGRWYFALHEAGEHVPQLQSLYFEYDEITWENLLDLSGRLPEAAAFFRFILDHFDALRAHIEKPDCTFTYNDFHWTNFIVSQNGQAALMFDYNLMGRGYRYADFRNLQSLSDEAYEAFASEYERLYRQKHGCGREEAAREEAQIDAIAAPLFALMAAYQQEEFPDWATEEKQKVLDGTLFTLARELLQ